MKGKSALLVIDIQNDFCPGGALPVPGGDKIVDAINEYMERFSEAGVQIFATKDYHPVETKHFKEFGGIWPRHCVKGTPGAEFYPKLVFKYGTVVLTKGDRSNVEGSSVFEARDPVGNFFNMVLEAGYIKHIYVCGLATDWCVKATVMDALKKGYKVTVLLDAIKGVDVTPGDSEKAIEEMKKNGANMITLDELKLP
ncbi:MAG: isochorismatase family protein [Deltaproteobacteria bacterium]|nr:isochorismatase family protein [Deltaproteobacteria bacterium]